MICTKIIPKVFHVEYTHDRNLGLQNPLSNQTLPNFHRQTTQKSISKEHHHHSITRHAITTINASRVIFTFFLFLNTCVHVRVLLLLPINIYSKPTLK